MLPALVLDWVISLRSSGSFGRKVNREPKIWAPVGLFYLEGSFLMRQH